MKKVPFEVVPIHIRLKTIVMQETDESGRFGWLQKKTGISRNTWQTWWDKAEAPPNGKMLEATARLWPKYAFWLISGIGDVEYGHTFPKSQQKSVTWPEYEGREIRAGNDYFEHCINMQEKLSHDAYAGDKEWNRDWEKVNDLAWQREIEINAPRLIGRSYEDRLTARPAKVNPWRPNDGDGEHDDE